MTEMPLNEEKIFARAGLELGRFNLGLFGPSGVGKSTLVNAIFGVSLAGTGVGGPVTQKAHLYRPHGSMLGVFDTKGLEVGSSNEQILEDLSAFIAETRESPISEQLHVAWYCTSYHSRRFTDGDDRFVRRLASLGLPVIMVMTQVPSKCLVPDADALMFARSIEARHLPAVGGRVLLVNAEADDFDGTERYGLTDLLDQTRRASPNGVRAALDAAQSMERKRKRIASEEIIEDTVSGTRVMAGNTPATWADMIFKISVVYGVPPGAALETLRASPLYKRADRLHKTAGQWLFIPIAGQVAFAGHALVLDDTTRAIGQSWQESCSTVWRPSYMGGPTWNAKVMSSILESALKRHLPWIFTIDK